MRAKFNEAKYSDDAMKLDEIFAPNKVTKYI